MDLQLTDKIALVAGSSRGIGKATARAFLAERCRTVVTGRQPESLAQTRAELEAEFGTERVLAFQGDLTTAEAIHDLRQLLQERWGIPDCIVANIGYGRGPGGWRPEERDWDAAFSANLWGSVRLLTAILPDLVEAGRGSIVLVSSIVGLEGTPAPLPYSAAKSALINYGKNLARQVACHNLRVNCVAPGNILFPGGSWEKHLSERREQVEAFVRQEVPLQRFGRPEEIADLIVYLSSPRAAFITGACVVADGGQTRSY